jgi:hypothetical protein
LCDPSRARERRPSVRCQLHAEFQQSGSVASIKDRLDNEATNPFVVTSDSNVQIGEVIAALNYVYHGMSMGEEEGDQYLVIGTEARMELKVLPKYIGPTEDNVCVMLCRVLRCVLCAALWPLTANR